MPPPGWCAVGGVNRQSALDNRTYLERMPAMDQISVGEGKPILFTPGLGWRPYHIKGEFGIPSDGEPIRQVALTVVSPL